MSGDKKTIFFFQLCKQPKLMLKLRHVIPHLELVKATKKAPQIQISTHQLGIIN